MNTMTDTLEDYSDLLRELCCMLSVGGWNSEGLMPVETARAKIIDGLDFLTKPLLQRIEELKLEINRLNHIVAMETKW